MCRVHVQNTYVTYLSRFIPLELIHDRGLQATETVMSRTLLSCVVASGQPMIGRWRWPRKTADWLLLLRRRERLRSIVMSMSVCVSLPMCLSVRKDIPGTTRAICTKCLCMLPMPVARFSSGRVAKSLAERGNFGVFLPQWQCNVGVWVSVGRTDFT